MKNRKLLATRILAISLAGGLAVALSGCGALLHVDNANGAGTCDGHPVSIKTTQDTPGENVIVTYTGPAAVSLFLSPSVYSDTSFNGQTSERLVTLGARSDSSLPDAAIYKLQTGTTGWATTGSGDSTTYTFSGSFTQLLNGHSPIGDNIFGPNTEPVLDTISPYSVMVDCTSSDDTRLLVSTTDSSLIPSAPTFTAAASLYPNHVIIDPLVVTSSVADPGGNGVTGTLRFPASAVVAFNGLNPTGANVVVFADDPNIPNTDFSSLYAQGLASISDASFNIDGAVNLTGDNAFTFKSNGPTLADGHYLLAILLGNDSVTAVKAVFSEASYSATTGFTISDPFVTAAADEPALATTGMNAVSTGFLTGGSALFTALGLGIVIALRRRKTHN